jgi:hypothetical protein
MKYTHVTFIFLLVVSSSNVFSANKALLQDYKNALSQTSALFEETAAMLEEYNSKKGRANGGFESEENMNAGMLSLKKFGDVRLAIERVYEDASVAGDDELSVAIRSACDALLKIVQEGTNRLLDAYQNVEDAEGTKESVSFFEKNLKEIKSSKGAYAIKVKI